jgi:hypothetical protein
MSGDTPIATIDGVAVRCAELYARDKVVVDAIKATYDNKLAEIHELTLRELIDDRLLTKAAEGAKLSVEEFVGANITAVPATEEDIKSFYDQAIASGEKLPAFEEVKADIGKFVTEQRQKEALSKFRAELRSKSKLENLLPKPPPPPKPAPTPATPAPKAEPTPAKADAGAPTAP